jgi:hypothetical protein
MAGAITVAEVITMDGVEAIIMDGAIIIVGETSLRDHFERSRLRAAFSFVATLRGSLSWHNSRTPDVRLLPLSSLLRRAKSVSILYKHR